MKKFHICYYPEKGVNLTIGINIEAESMEIALKIFTTQHPYSEISYIHNKSI
jgi:hypothetical protein